MPVSGEGLAETPKCFERAPGASAALEALGEIESSSLARGRNTFHQTILPGLEHIQELGNSNPAASPASRDQGQGLPFAVPGCPTLTTAMQGSVGRLVPLSTRGGR